MYYDTPEGIKIEISYKKEGTSYIRELFIPYSELVTKQNHEFWQDYLYDKIPQLIEESALHSKEHQIYEQRQELRRQWEEEQKVREATYAYRKLLHDTLSYIPLGRNLDYEHYFHDYIRQIMEWKHRDEDDFSYLLQRLKRWAAKTCIKHMEKGRPDVAYVLAKCFFTQLPKFLSREDVAPKLEDSYQKTKINKIIRLYIEALTQAVEQWNHEEKRQELLDLLKEQSAGHPLIQKQVNRLATTMPLAPFTGEPMTITYQLTAAEKRAEAYQEAQVRAQQRRLEEEMRERNALVKTNPEYEKLMKCGRYDWEGSMLATTIRLDFTPVMKRLLAAGKTYEAVMSFLQLLKSLSKHFVKDEHYNYFDDMYSPDYECTDLCQTLIKHLQKHPDAESQHLLNQGLAEIRQMEAFTDYGIPSLCMDMI